jgi:peptidoglycan/xylan/chitin deacetylase (PgdA/CDA1 family)
MYHEVVAQGHAPQRGDAGYLRYVLEEGDFKAQLDHLVQRGRKGMSVSQALAAGAPAGVVALTFDDGCRTDLHTAAPLLQERGFGATFYAVARFVGQPGFLTVGELRALADMGFEIGSHSLTHAYLRDLTADQVRLELRMSKEMLEDFTGRPIRHFACPGGSWARHIDALAREAGYVSVATSRPGMNAAGADPFRLRRIPILRGLGLAGFDRLCEGRGLFASQVRHSLLAPLKSLMGHDGYGRLRSALLGGAR